VRHEPGAVGEYRRDPFQPFGQLRRWCLVTVEDAPPRALIELVDTLVEIRVFLHQPQIGLADRIGHVCVHQRPQIERANLRRRCAGEDRELDGLGGAGMPRAQLGCEQQHARRHGPGCARPCNRSRG